MASEFVAGINELFGVLRPGAALADAAEAFNYGAK